MLKTHLKKLASKGNYNLNIRRVEKEHAEWAGRALASSRLVRLIGHLAART